jgi:hypothetical protein
VVDYTSLNKCIGGTLDTFLLANRPMAEITTTPIKGPKPHNKGCQLASALKTNTCKPYRQASAPAAAISPENNPSAPNSTNKACCTRDFFSA